MIQGRRSLCLLNKAPHAILMNRNISRQDLQRNFAIEFRVLRQKHLAHPARTELRADFVATEFCAGGNAHVVWRKLSACGIAFSYARSESSQTNSLRYCGSPTRRTKSANLGSE